MLAALGLKSESPMAMGPRHGHRCGQEVQELCHKEEHPEA